MFEKFFSRDVGEEQPSSDKEYELCGGKAGKLHISMFKVFPLKYKTNRGQFVVVEGDVFVDPESYSDRGEYDGLEQSKLLEGVMKLKDSYNEFYNAYLASHSLAELKDTFGIADSGTLEFKEQPEGEKVVEISSRNGVFDNDVIDQKNRLKTAQLVRHALNQEVSVTLV